MRGTVQVVFGRLILPHPTRPGKLAGMSAPERDVYTVGRLNREVRLLIEHGMPTLWVEGELTNFSRPASGHWYFTLKDRDAQVRCAMFRQRNSALRFVPKDGQLVMARVRVGLYEPRGEYQLQVEHLEDSGVGALRREFDRLKDKLQAEGLFASTLKRPLPTLLVALADGDALLARLDHQRTVAQEGLGVGDQRRGGTWLQHLATTVVADAAAACHVIVEQVGEETHTATRGVGVVEHQLLFPSASVGDAGNAFVGIDPGCERSFVGLALHAAHNTFDIELFQGELDLCPLHVDIRRDVAERHRASRFVEDGEHLLPAFGFCLGLFSLKL